MQMRSTARPLVVGVLAFCCVSLAVAFPGWRANLAHATGYSYLGCANKGGGGFNVVLSEGDVTTEMVDCGDGLSDLLASCSLEDEDNFATDKAQSFASFYRLWCVTD